MLSNKFVVIVFLAFATGAHAQTRDLVNANAQGNRAYDAGKFERALDKYQQALNLAVAAGDVQYRAIAIYGMARASAQLCRTTEADAFFRQSISLREGIPDDPQKAYLTQNWIEFGRFLFVNNKPAEAVSYFAKAMPALEDLDIEGMDPIGYAEFLETYVAALKASADMELAQTLALRASELRAKYSGQVARFKPVEYRADCKS